MPASFFECVFCVIKFLVGTETGWAMLRDFMTKHVSFFVMAASAASLYFSNIFLSVSLGAQDYGKYALFISIIAVANGFGFLGLDQALVRTARSSGSDSLVINRRLLRFALLAGLGFVVSATSYGVYGIGLPGVSLGVSVLATILGLAGYAYGRVVRAYGFSQFAHGGARIVFFLCVLLLSQIKFGYEDVAWCYAVSSVAVGVFVVYVFSKSRFEADTLERSDIWSFAIGYFFSMLIMNFIGFADRFVIQEALGLEKAAAFFFYSNIYIYPFSLLASYVGFKELSKYKQSFTMADFHRDLGKSFRVAVGVALLCCASDYIGSIVLGGFKFSLSVEEKILMVVLGSGRILYSALSAVLGAVVEAKSLNLVNGFTFLAIACSWVALGFSEKTMVVILALFVGVWLARSVAVYAVVWHASRRSS